MTIIETIISKNYIPNWGLKEGVRELIQNAIDSETRGSEKTIEYNLEKQHLVISNKGAELQRSNFLLGDTTKLNDSTQLGVHGEGMCLASLALIREGKELFIKNGPQGEIYEAKLQFSDTYKEHILTYKVVTGTYPTEDLTFTVKNITQEEWDEIKPNFLCLYTPDSENIHKTKLGNIHLHKDFKGKIYVGGLYISTVDELEYGYDYKPEHMELNRDRDLCNYFYVRYRASEMWAGIDNQDEVYRMLKEDKPDVEFLDTFIKKTKPLVESFVEDHKDDMIGDKPLYPVTSTDDSDRVGGLGYTPIITTPKLAQNLRRELGNVYELESRARLNFEEVDVKLNDDLAFQFIFAIDPSFELDIVPVKFIIKDIKSLTQKDILYINFSIAEDEYEILHEVVRHYSGIREVVETKVWMRILQFTMKR